jgi:hypothetical protein
LENPENHKELIKDAVIMGREIALYALETVRQSFEGTPEADGFTWAYDRFNLIYDEILNDPVTYLHSFNMRTEFHSYHTNRQELIESMQREQSEKMDREYREKCTQPYKS